MKRDFSRKRYLLHLSKVGEFHTWLLSQGWLDEPLKEYELIRMIHSVRPCGRLIVWKRLAAKEHATTQGESDKWYQKWKKRKRNGTERRVPWGRFVRILRRVRNPTTGA